MARRDPLGSPGAPTDELHPASNRMKFAVVVGAVAVIGLVWGIAELIAPGWPYRYFRLWTAFVGCMYWWLVGVFVARRYGVDLMARPSRGTTADRPEECPSLDVVGTRELPRVSPWRRSARWVFGYVLPPILLIIALGEGLGEAMPAWKAVHQGQPGVLNLGYGFCLDDGECFWHGYFLPDDNSGALYEVEMDGTVPGARVGLNVPVMRSPTTGYAYPRNSTTWRVPAIVALACALYVLGAIAWLIRRIWRIRHPADAPPAPILATDGTPVMWSDHDHLD